MTPDRNFAVSEFSAHSNPIPRIVLALSVLVAHAAVFYILRGSNQVNYRPEDSPSFFVKMLDAPISPIGHIISVPTISALSMRLDAPQAPSLKVDTSSETPSFHVEAARVDTSSPIEPFTFPRGERIRARQVTVTLLIEVRADGSVGDVDVKASGGDAQTNAAAVAYVRKLRWKPAVTEGNATTMKVLFSVTANQGS